MLTLKKVDAQKGTKLQIQGAGGKNVGFIWLRGDVDPKDVILTVKT